MVQTPEVEQVLRQVDRGLFAESHEASCGPGKVAVGLHAWRLMGVLGGRSRGMLSSLHLPMRVPCDAKLDLHCAAFCPSLAYSLHTWMRRTALATQQPSLVRAGCKRSWPSWKQQSTSWCSTLLACA